MSDTCFICYVNPTPADTSLKCGIKVCEECLINWIKAEAKYDFVKVGRPTRDIDDAINKQEAKNYSNIIETIKCVNIQCQKDAQNPGDEEAPEEIHHRLTYEECLSFIQKSETQQYKDDFSRVMLDLLTNNSQYLLKCPKENCDYIGFINPRNKCNDDLICEQCAYSWNDPNLAPFWTKLKKGCCSWNMNLNLFNQFQKVLRAQGCPNCGISIIKGPGCKHMVCQQCKHEFCWNCLGDYFNYQHGDNVLWCPFRNIIKIFLWIYIIILTVNLKCCYEFEPYKNFMLDVGEFVAILLLGNLISLSVFLVITFYACYDEARHSYSSISRCCSSLGCCMMFLWPLIWIAGLIVMYIKWPLARTMAVYLMWQWIGIISLAFLIFIITVLVKCIQNKIENRRYLRSLNQMSLIAEENPVPLPYNGSILQNMNRADDLDDDMMRAIRNSLEDIEQRRAAGQYVPPDYPEFNDAPITIDKLKPKTTVIEDVKYLFQGEDEEEEDEDVSFVDDSPKSKEETSGVFDRRRISLADIRAETQNQNCIRKFSY